MNRSPVVTVCLATCLMMVLTFLIAPASLGADQIVEQSAISFGQTVSGTIAAPGETDTYTFTAYSGDLILIGMSRVSGDLWQRIRLYGPGGKLLRDERSPVHVEIAPVLPDRYLVYLPLIANHRSARTGGNTTVLDSRIQATVPGIYTIVVSDGFNGTMTGSYNLYIQRLNEPSGATAVTFCRRFQAPSTNPLRWTLSPLQPTPVTPFCSA
jgi:hypothetical protein